MAFECLMRKAVGCGPNGPFASPPSLEARAAFSLHATLYLIEVEDQGVLNHREAPLGVDLRPVACLSFVLFPQQSHAFKGRREVGSCPLSSPRLQIVL